MIMVVLSHIAIGLQLIALALGGLVYAKGTDKKLKLITAVGIVVMAFAIISLVATVYYTSTYWNMVSHVVLSNMAAHGAMTAS